VRGFRLREREIEIERERERRIARRCNVAETNGEKEETRETEKRENKQFFRIKKYIY
jgi:hypothetical protein